MTTVNLLFQIIDVSSDDVPMGGEGKEFKVTFYGKTKNNETKREKTKRCEAKQSETKRRESE